MQYCFYELERARPSRGVNREISGHPVCESKKTPSGRKVSRVGGGGGGDRGGGNIISHTTTDVPESSILLTICGGTQLPTSGIRHSGRIFWMMYS